VLPHHRSPAEPSWLVPEPWTDVELGPLKSGKEAQIELVERTGSDGRTCLLAVQRALYPEADLCHVYLLHPPGGVAGGDLLNISIQVRDGGAALITTPGATKFYRSVAPRAFVRQSLKIMNGSLEWLPQENILFPGANVGLAA